MPKHVIRTLIGCLAIAIALFAGEANAQTGHGGAGTPDPFVLSYVSTPTVPIRFPTSCDTYGRQPTSLQGVDITKRNLIIIQSGQSNNMNTAPSAFTPVNVGKIDNMNICDGAIYPVPSDPLIGAACVLVTGCVTPGCASTGCLGDVMTRVADTLLTAGNFDRVIILPNSVGSTPVSAWSVGGGLSFYNSRVGVALARLAAKGITASTTNVTIIVIWGQGETDCGLGTTQANYVASWNAMYTAAGPRNSGVRWFVNKESWDTASPGFCTAIQSAQTAASPSGVVNTAAGIWPGANADALTGATACSGGTACRQSDNLHFTDNGNISLNADATNGLQQALHASGSPF
jgi:hypothetical protein